MDTKPQNQTPDEQHKQKRDSQSSDRQSSNLHVITENGEQCFMWRSNQLTYIAQDRQELPHVLASKFGPLATKLDLSYNTLSSYKYINLFANLSELVLDNNCFEDKDLEFELNLRLKTLSLNKNKLKDLRKLVGAIKSCFPNLEYLSLIGNPLCPKPIACNLMGRELNENEADNSKISQDGDSKLMVCNQHQDQALDSNVLNRATSEELAEFAYQKYRYFIIYHLPNLRFLDSTPISCLERDEALRRCFWMESFKQTTTTTSNLSAQQQQQQANSCLTNAANQQSFQMTGISQPTAGCSQQPKGAFSRLSYKYTGRNSEGNRFIRNHDL